jgi:hypothetical protein
MKVPAFVSCVKNEWVEKEKKGKEKEENEWTRVGKNINKTVFWNDSENAT